ncbi:hypothetical protein [Actinomadura parmotrematis]|uniref:Amidohydrolase n=1 Tax=Actinomadura parmotrematis TaxID=2864039 RepID=A0ABS7G541_9ACTN|nr:hypothetical protein [Actinomadura parmotrematis]MBW8486743.1 hypothetical protein [Actinomadura parmotrematis]
MIIDVHAHVLLPEVERAVAGQPGLDAHRGLDARRNGAASLTVSGRMVGERIGKLTQAPVRLAAPHPARPLGTLVAGRAQGGGEQGVEHPRRRHATPSRRG